PERRQRPVLQEDIDRLAQCRGAGRQHGGGLQLVVGSGEENQVQGLVHGGYLVAEGLAGGNRRAGLWTGGATVTGRVAAVAATAPRRSRWRSRTPRMIPQATITSGSASR